MPTIEVSLKDICRLVGKKMTGKEFEEHLQYAKGETECVDGDRIKLEIADTNRPDLWSAEGIAREIRSCCSSKKGLRRYEIKKSGLKVIVDSSLKNIRPKTVCAVVRDLKIDNDVLFQMIQLQEKVCETFGRKRRDVAIGVYNFHKIKSPITFRAYGPEDMKFVPLGFDKEMTLREILLKHPKGQEYGHLLEGLEKYPVFIDGAKNVLSMPPVINSDYTGKVTSETRDLFIECSGFDLKFLIPGLNIMVSALAERGGRIETVEVVFPDEKITTPDLKPGKMIVSLDYIRKRSGLEISTANIKNLLLKAGYDVKITRNKLEALYPAYRQDIMHPADVVEDLIIRYGYNKIEPIFPKIPTSGSMTKINRFSGNVREVMAGLGAQEVLSYYLTGRENLIRKMCLREMEVMELENPVSENWCIFRTWIIPSIMEFLGKNSKKEHPQQVFEIGEVIIPDKTAETRSLNPVRLAWAVSGKEAGFTQAKQALDYLMGYVDVKYEIREAEHDSFIPGRVGRVFVNDKSVAYIGEVHPQVLENFGLENPVACFELNLTDLLAMMKK
jgi:phenylalanyl-tRNA synthetase beta chain